MHGYPTKEIPNVVAERYLEFLSDRHAIIIKDPCGVSDVKTNHDSVRRLIPDFLNPGKTAVFDIKKSQISGVPSSVGI